MEQNTKLPKVIERIDLETKAIDNKGGEYNVCIKKSIFGNTQEAILHIEGTPGSWYLDGLIVKRSMKSIYIDYGSDWTIENLAEILQEAFSLMNQVKMKDIIL